MKQPFDVHLFTIQRTSSVLRTMSVPMLSDVQTNRALKASKYPEIRETSLIEHLLSKVHVLYLLGENQRLSHTELTVTDFRSLF